MTERCSESRTEGQPIFCIEISNESDLDEKEIAAAVQDEREEKQR